MEHSLHRIALGTILVLLLSGCTQTPKEPATEFNGARDALVSIAEMSSEVAAQLSESLGTAEAQIAIKDSDGAAESLIEMLGFLDSLGEDTLSSELAAEFRASLAMDLDTMGAPPMKLEKHDDKCCDDAGRCGGAMAGNTCYEVIENGTHKGCTGKRC